MFYTIAADLYRAVLAATIIVAGIAIIAGFSCVKGSIAASGRAGIHLACLSRAFYKIAYGAAAGSRDADMEGGYTGLSAGAVAWAPFTFAIYIADRHLAVACFAVLGFALGAAAGCICGYSECLGAGSAAVAFAGAP